MKNLISDGNTITVTAGGTVTSGSLVLSGSLAGVAQHDAASGKPLTLALTGVFSLPKVGSQAWTQGIPIYWNGTACTSVASTNKMIGCAAAAVGGGAGETTGYVRLNGGVVTA